MAAKKLTAPAATATWSPTYVSTPSVLSGGNLTLTANTGAAGTYANAVSSLRIQSLGYYSARLETNSGDAAGFGVVAIESPPNAAAFPLDSADWLGLVATGGALWVNSGDIYLNSGVAVAGPGTSAATVELAVRFAAGSPNSFVRVWARVSGGSWYGGGDPVTDTTPSFICTYTNSTPYQIALGACLTKSGATSGRFCTLHPDTASTTGTPPSGFTAALWGAATS